MNLPPLPEPDYWSTRGDDTPLFTADQMLEYARAALAESERDWSLLEATQGSLREHMAEIQTLRAALAAERERCAALCDGTAGVCEDIANGIKRTAGVSAAKSCARLIRGQTDGQS